jgi:hypothetical protein
MQVEGRGKDEVRYKGAVKDNEEDVNGRHR